MQKVYASASGRYCTNTHIYNGGCSCTIAEGGCQGGALPAALGKYKLIHKGR